MDFYFQKLLPLIPLLLFSGPVIAGPDSPEPEYEMTTYYVGFLHRGPTWTPEETPEVERIQAKHLAHIQKMVDSGDLLLAGPFLDGGELRGMLVFQVGSREEAEALANSDPAVKAGRLIVNIHPWYSAKGIRIDPPTN